MVVSGRFYAPPALPPGKEQKGIFTRYFDVSYYSGSQCIDPEVEDAVTE
jgi:hypothetical protein